MLTKGESVLLLRCHSISGSSTYEKMLSRHSIRWAPDAKREDLVRLGVPERLRCGRRNVGCRRERNGCCEYEQPVRVFKALN